MEGSSWGVVEKWRYGFHRIHRCSDLARSGSRVACCSDGSLPTCTLDPRLKNRIDGRHQCDGVFADDQSRVRSTLRLLLKQEPGNHVPSEMVKPTCFYPAWSWQSVIAVLFQPDKALNVDGLYTTEYHQTAVLVQGSQK